MSAASRASKIQHTQDEDVPNGFTSHFTYEVEYYLRGCPKARTKSLSDRCLVAINDVGSAAAPVAYRISPHGAAHAPYDVRAFDKKLWWPLYGASGHTSADEFLYVARNEWEVARAILDPRKRTCNSVCQSEETFLGSVSSGKKGARRLDWDEQENRCKRDAARILFCDRHVYVEAGPPIWYASPKKDARDGFDLEVGHSALARTDGKYRLPGANFDHRERCARRNDAYGLDEAERRLWSLGVDINHCSDIEVSTDCQAGPAAELCARALLQYLWRIARHTGLDKMTPAFEDAKRHDWPLDEPPSRAVLLEFIALVRGEPRLRLNGLADDAERIIERWDLLDSQPLASVDDQALADLGI